MALDAGLDVNTMHPVADGKQADTEPRSMLYVAYLYNHVDVARFLISKGAASQAGPAHAGPNAALDTAAYPIFWELTHLCNRNQSAHVASIKRALHAGLHVNAMQSVKRRNNAHPENEPHSMLYIACKRKLVSVARFLISRGADVNQCMPATRDTPLFAAIEAADEASLLHVRQAVIVIDLLHKKGANFGHSNACGNTVLHKWAYGDVSGGKSAEDERSIVSRLMQAGADRALVNDAGYTALMVAADTSAVRMRAMMQYAVHAGAPVQCDELDAQNARGDTCLHLLIRFSSKDAGDREGVIERLIDAGASLHIENHDGESADSMLSDPNTCQHLAIDNYPVLEAANVALCKLIQSNNSMQDIIDAAKKVTDINAHNRRHPAALFTAVSNDRVDVILYLLTIGADALYKPMTRVLRNDPHDILVWALRRGQCEDRSIWTYLTPEPPVFEGSPWNSSTDMQIILINSVFDVRASDRAPERKPAGADSRFRSTLQLYIFEAMSAVCHEHVLQLLLQIAGREQDGAGNARDEDGLGAVQRTVLNFRHCDGESRMMQRAKLLHAVCSNETILWDRSGRHKCPGMTCQCCHDMCAHFKPAPGTLKNWEDGAFTLLGLLLYRTLPAVLNALWDRDEDVPPHVDYLRDVVVPHVWHLMMRSRVLACLMGAHPRLGNRDCKLRLLDDSVLYTILDMFETGFSAVETRRVLTTTDLLVGA